MEKLIGIFLVSLFSVFIVTPTVVVFIDKGFEHSFLYTINEEEQNGEDRKFGEKPTKLLHKFLSFTPRLLSLQTKIIPFAQCNHWDNVYSELHIPPPERV